MMAQPDALVIELRLLRAAVADLQLSHDHLLRQHLARADRRTGAALLPLAADLAGGREITAPELAAWALNDRTPSGRALCGLVEAYITDEGGLRALGRFLARIEGAPLGGHRLERAGPSRDGLRWRVVRVSGAD